MELEKYAPQYLDKNTYPENSSKDQKRLIRRKSEASQLRDWGSSKQTPQLGYFQYSKVRCSEELGVNKMRGAGPRIGN